MAAMHVAHVQGIFSPEHGGPLHSTSNYCLGQVGQGHRVSLWVLEGYPNTSPAVRLQPPVEMHVHSVGAPARLGRSSGMKNELLASDPADVYHLHGVWLRAMYYGALKANRSSRPYVVELMGAYEPFAMGQKWLRKSLTRRWFQDRLLHRAACLHVNSTKEADYLRQLGFRTPIVTLPVGVDTDSIDRRMAAADAPASWPQLSGRPFLLFLARLHRNKGVDMLLDAWSKLAARYPDWTLALAGSGDPEYERQCRQQANDLGIADRCAWLGQVTDEQKSWLYGHCGIYVLPSHSENFGNTVAEAMAHGAPFITGLNTPWGDAAAQGCGWMTDPNREAVFEVLHEALAADDKQRRAMGERGREVVRQRYSLRFVLSRLQEVYDWAGGKSGRPSFVG